MKKEILLVLLFVTLYSCDKYKYANQIVVVNIKNTTDSTVSIVTNIGNNDTLFVLSELSKIYNPGDTYSYNFGSKPITFLEDPSDFFIKLTYKGKFKVDKNSYSNLDSINIFRRRLINNTSSNKNNKKKHPDTVIYNFIITQDDLNEAK